MIVVRNGSVTPSVTGWRPFDASGVSAAARRAAAVACRSSRTVCPAWVRVACDTPSDCARERSVRAAPSSAGPAELKNLPAASLKQPERSSASSALPRSSHATRWAWSSGLLTTSRIRSFCQ